MRSITPNGIAGLKTEVTLEQLDSEGNIKDFEKISNTITNQGLAVTADLLGQVGEASNVGFQWLAVGDSGTAHGSGDTSLNNEITAPTDLDRASATSSRVTTSVASDTLQLVHTFTNSSSNQITVKETGMFDTSTEDSGNMLGAVTFSDKNLENNDTLKITYKVQVS